jgi:hypothetical protein
LDGQKRRPSTIHLNISYGTVSPKLDVIPLTVATTGRKFVSLELEDCGPHVFFDSISDLREFATIILEKCDEIEKEQ